MESFIQTDDRIVITERMSAGMRVFLFVVGLLPWLAPYELLIRPGWTGFSIFTLFFLIISLGAVAVSLAFIGGAIFGMNQTLRFDANTETVRYTYETSITKLREKNYSFRDISSIELHTHEWDSRPYTYGLQIVFSDKRKVQVGDIAEKAVAESYRHTLLGWVKLS
jgi:hypothetical protein